MRAAGINIINVLQRVITIEGQPDAIRQVANYDFVRNISLSQTRYPVK